MLQGIQIVFTKCNYVSVWSYLVSERVLLEGFQVLLVCPVKSSKYMVSM